MFGNSGDGGPAVAASINGPTGMAFDAAGDAYLADQNNNRVRKISPAGTITNFAGSPAGVAGNTGDGGPATSATLAAPEGVAVDRAGNVYIADSLDNRVRKVDTSGTITNFAGDPAANPGSTGDGGPATSALLDQPSSVGVDADGDVYISDWNNDRVRQVLAYTSNQAPAITSAAVATFTVGVAALVGVTTTGFPTPTVSETGALPSGITFNSVRRALSGTAAPGTAGTYPIVFTAANGVGTDATQSFTLTVGALAGYQPPVPVRICDTRASGAGVVANQCDTHGHSPLSTGGTLAVTVAGAAGVPADATAVVLHVTATGTNAASFLTVWPAGQAQPTAASLNWSPGQTVSNLVETGVGTGGRVSVFNYAFSVDVIVDLVGYVRTASGGLFVPLPPTRVCDTRLGQAANQCNQNGTASGALGAGKSRKVQVGSAFGVPAGATAVVLNVTATTTTAASFVDIWPDGAAAPLASSLNWAPGQTVSNRVVTAISPTGKFDVFNANGSTDLVIDMAGYYTTSGSGSGFIPIAPIRICDTRPVGPGVASNACNSFGLGTLQGRQSLSLNILDPTITALVFNVTVTNTKAAGFLTVYPDDSAAPLTADLTWAAHQTVGNLVVANAGSTATTDIFNGSIGSTDVIVDLVGYYVSAVPPAAAGSRRARPLVPGIRAGRTNRPHQQAGPRGPAGRR